MKYVPHPYQTFNTQHIINNKAAGVFLDMGLGKTVSTLTAIDQLINSYMEVDCVLVIAPKNVTENVWAEEAAKWGHLRHLRVVKIIGDERQRKQALNKKGDIFCVSVDNFEWLTLQFRTAWPFKMVVVDESSLFKNHDSVRFKTMEKIRPFIERIVILSGTPAPNGIVDLWSQIFMLDRGKRLGEYITWFRDRFLLPSAKQGHITTKWILKPGSEEQIYDLIADICISMKSEQYLDLPECIYNEIPVQLPDDAYAEYKRFKRDAVLELMSGQELTAVNASALSIKLTQFANGAVYDQSKKWHEVHTAKIAALKEIVETSAGKSMIVFYWFKHDLERLQKAFPKGKTFEGTKDLQAWNAGKIKIMFVHPASAGHGLNFQYGGNICIWFSLTWDLQLYQQANKRLHRQGQEQTVIIHHLIARGTMDERIIKALHGKADIQNALLDAVNVEIDEVMAAA